MAEISTEALTAATVELKQAASNVADAVQTASTALDDVAAKLAAALAQIGNIPPEVQAAIDQATGDIGGQTQKLNAAAAALKAVAAKDDPDLAPPAPAPEPSPVPEPAPQGDSAGTFETGTAGTVAGIALLAMVLVSGPAFAQAAPGDVTTGLLNTIIVALLASLPGIVLGAWSLFKAYAASSAAKWDDEAVAFVEKIAQGVVKASAGTGTTAPITGVDH